MKKIFKAFIWGTIIGMVLIFFLFYKNDSVAVAELHEAGEATIMIQPKSDNIIVSLSNIFGLPSVTFLDIEDPEKNVSVDNTGIVHLEKGHWYTLNGIGIITMENVNSCIIGSYEAQIRGCLRRFFNEVHLLS